jgi:phosphoribosylformimino-5-aminoimidazole carboxamide ribotide isomerase
MSFTIFPAIDAAQRWLEAGASWLHVVNLDGAFGESDEANHSALESILKLGAKVQFGGGLRSLKAIENAIRMGVSRAVLGTIAIEKPDIVAEAINVLGPENIAVGIDARDGRVRLHGWKSQSDTSAKDLALQMQTLGLRTVIFTDISRDGLGCGLNIAATRELAELSTLDVIASGGVRTIKDVNAARNANLSGIIIGRALYEGTIDLREAVSGVTNAG